MTTVQVSFKFEIGQIVQHKMEPDRTADKLFILERMYKECEGGGQKHYIVRHGIWNKEINTFNEGELTEYVAEREPTYNEKARIDQKHFSDKLIKPSIIENPRNLDPNKMDEKDA